jgi:hypothetical protein
MATTAIHRLTLDPMGKCSNAFFSETTNMIKAKLYMNVHWMVLYNLKVYTYLEENHPMTISSTFCSYCANGFRQEDFYGNFPWGMKFLKNLLL